MGQTPYAPPGSRVSDPPEPPPQDGGDAHWLESAVARRASDLSLGVLLLLVGLFALAHLGSYPVGTLRRLGPGAFPSVVGGLLCVVAVVLLIRGALRRAPPVRRTSPHHVAIVAAVVVALSAAVWAWGNELFIRFGPAEFMALILLLLAIATSLAHTSRIRALGMALFGLFLVTVGTDVNSGVLRFSLGISELSDGIGSALVLFGLFIVGDAVVCLASPPLFVRTYARLISTWRPSAISAPMAHSMRVVAALAFAFGCYYAYRLSNSYFDIALLLAFGMLGAAAKMLGWNRFLLFMGFALGGMLEENIRRALLLAAGDPSALMRRPFSGTLLVVAMAVFAAALVFSVRRTARSSAPPSGA